MRNPAAVMLSFLTLGGLTAFSSGMPLLSAPAAAAGPIQIERPFNKAVVRESVPIKLRDFPKHGYVSISIDGKFITAQALPKSQSAPVYVWDSKATYTSTDNPDTPQTYNDGLHAITVAVYDTDNKLVGEDSVSVQLADKINLPASEGIRLEYPWRSGLTMRYQRRTTLSAAPTDSSTAASVQILQQSLLRFERSVENVSGGTSLVRDSVISVDKSARPKPFVSYVATHGQSQALADGIHARYREVDRRGQVLGLLTSQNTESSVGFSIPVLPPRRVSVGAHWQSPVQISLDWSSPTPVTVKADSTLVDFEWQDRYPTAKIRETYSGPATFSPGSALPAITSQNIQFERIIYFAYNAGRVVRTQTTLTLTSTDPGLLNASPVPGGYPGGAPGGFGRPPGSYGPPPGFVPPGGFGGRPPGYPAGMSGSFGPPPGFVPPTGYGPPGGYPGQGGYPGAGGPAMQTASPTKLTYTETAVLLT